MEGSPAPRAVRFGVFEADLRARELRKNGLKIGLQDQPFQLLSLLLEHPGEVITREELRKKLWLADTFVDFDDGLNTAIRKLRQALGDSADNPRFVETLPRHGYRFIASVEELSRSESQSAKHPATEALPAARSSRSPAFFMVVGGIVVILLLIAAIYFEARRDSRLRAANPQRIRSLVILPLANLTGDPSQDYFVDAMTDSLTTDLAQIHELRVISGTSAMHYKGTKKTLPEIARELNVDGVVEGTVFRSGDHVRITAQLVDAPADRHLWARSYERDLRDVIRMQDEVARDIAGEIKVNLTPQEQQRLANASPVDAEAYQLYLQGQYFETRLTEDYLRKSVSTLQASIAKDPNFAPAHAALANTYNALSTNGYAPPLTELPKVKAELTRALELDDGLAETHAFLGQIKLTFDWDWAGGAREMQRAMELNPNSASSHAGQSIYLVVIGHFDEAFAEMRRARALDPVDLDASLYAGEVLLIAQRYDESISELKKTLELDPNFLPTHGAMALAYARGGRRAEASAEYEKTRSLMARHQALILDQWMAPVEILLGKRAEARENADWWTRESAHRYTDAYRLGAFYAELGFPDRAFQWLEKGFEQRSPSMAYMKFDASFPEGMRADPRFQDILRRMNLPN
jgi:TolB-like protein/DNA-binding winged helix-turn-helix (wHTH) protein/tetratricopeptide (TPR) repeat protein